MLKCGFSAFRCSADLPKIKFTSIGRQITKIWLFEGPTRLELRVTQSELRVTPSELRVWALTVCWATSYSQLADFGFP